MSRQCDNINHVEEVLINISLCVETILSMAFNVSYWKIFTYLLGWFKSTILPNIFLSWLTAQQRLFYLNDK